MPVGTLTDYLNPEDVQLYAVTDDGRKIWGKNIAVKGKADDFYVESEPISFCENTKIISIGAIYPSGIDHRQHAMVLMKTGETLTLVGHQYK